MKSIIKCEGYKLFKDRQIRCIVVAILVYLIFKVIFIDDPAYSIHVSVGEWIGSVTYDNAFMAMLVSLVASAVFAAEYSYNTYKNIVPYVKKSRLFKAKIITNLSGILIILIIWYMLGLIVGIIKTGNFLTFQDLKFCFYKFTTQYLMIVAHSGLLLLVSIVLHNRAITNISTVLLLFGYSFIPINGKWICMYIVHACIWGTIPNYILDLCFVLSFCICAFVSNAIFNMQEVRT